VPREAFLHELEDDLPMPSDLLLQRTLRQIRQESVIPQQREAAPRPRASPQPVEDLPEPLHAKPRRWPGYLAAAAVAAVVAFGGAAALMQNQAPQTSIAGPRTGEGKASGIELKANIEPSSQDRYEVTAKINGLPALQKCKLVVIAKDGTKSVATTWTSSEKGKAEGATVRGMVSVPSDQVQSIAVENTEGKQFVVANL
jgi:RNA polymerase sigma-70 factor (ECF subfamily)